MMKKLKIYDPRKDPKVKWKKITISRDGFYDEEVENWGVKVRGVYGGDRFSYDDENVYFELQNSVYEDLIKSKIMG